MKRITSQRLDLALTIILPLIVFALFIPHRHHGLSLWDEGTNICAVKRIYDGQVPYRDFHLIYGPVRFYLQAFLFWVLGVTVSTGKIYMIMTLALASMTTYLLARQIKICVPLSILCSFLILHNMTSLLVIPTFDRILWASLSLLLIMNYLNKEKKRDLFLSGLLTGFTFLIGQETGSCVIGTMAIILILKFINSPKGINKSSNILAELGILAGGVFCIIGPFLIYLIHQGAIRYYFIDSFIRFRQQHYISSNLNIMRSIAFTLKSLFREVIRTDNLRATVYAHRFFGLMFVYLFTIGFIFYKKCLIKANLKILLLALFGVFIFNVALIGYSGYHLLLVMLPGIILSAYFLQHIVVYQTTLANRKTSKARFTLTLFSIIVIAYISIHYLSSLRAVINIFSSLAKCRAWSINLDRAKLFFPSSTGPEIDAVFPFEKKEDLLELINYIKDNTSYDSKIFIATQDAMLYFLTKRDNATKFDNMSSGYLVAEDIASQKEIIEDLIREKSKYVIFSNVVVFSDVTGYELTSKQYAENLMPLVYDFLIKNYELEKNIGCFELWAPKKLPLISYPRAGITKARVKNEL